MKTRRLIAILVLFAQLLLVSFSATANENLSQGQTGFGNTTVSGYVGTSATWNSSSTHTGWFWEFLIWLGIESH